MAEQAIKMNKGGGEGGRRNKGAGEGEGCRIHADVSRKGKEEVALRGEEGGRKKGAEDGRMGNNHSTHTEDTLGATDLSRDGISHLKMQNTPNVKPHKHTLLLTSPTYNKPAARLKLNPGHVSDLLSTLTFLFSANTVIAVAPMTTFRVSFSSCYLIRDAFLWVSVGTFPPPSTGRSEVRYQLQRSNPESVSCLRLLQQVRCCLIEGHPTYSLCHPSGATLLALPAAFLLTLHLLHSNLSSTLSVSLPMSALRQNLCKWIINCCLNKAIDLHSWAWLEFFGVSLNTAG